MLIARADVLMVVGTIPTDQLTVAQGFIECELLPVDSFSVDESAFGLLRLRVDRTPSPPRQEVSSVSATRSGCLHIDVCHLSPAHMNWLHALIYLFCSSLMPRRVIIAV